jgi:ABC-2 type transport system permease protein
MRPDLNKIWVVASTEFGSLIRTKAFLVGLLVVPVISGLSIGLQMFVAKRVDTKTRTFAVVDRTGALYPAIERAVKAYNEQAVDARGQLVRPRLAVSAAGAGASDAAAGLELSDKVRRGELDAFAVIPAGAILPPPAADPRAFTMEYHSDNPNDDIIRNWLAATVNVEVRTSRFRAAGMDAALADRLNQPLALDNLGLVERAASTPATAAAGAPATKAAARVDPIRTAVVPAVLMFVMFLLVMSTTPQLLNSVIEEKMSKISEVLLGSITPFELMMGKLLGNTGIAMVLAVLYLAAGYGVATYYGYADAVSPGLMAALVVYMVLAILLFGSLYMAVGSACNDLKDAQSLMMPVMLLSMLPIFVWTAILTNPSSALSVGLSLFPTASPYLMLMRMAMRPSPPAWQVGLSIVGTALTALFCVWAAAKIFRTGLLMQGKAPSYRELARWVMAK